MLDVTCSATARGLVLPDMVDRTLDRGCVDRGEIGSAAAASGVNSLFVDVKLPLYIFGDVVFSGLDVTDAASAGRVHGGDIARAGAGSMDIPQPTASSGVDALGVGLEFLADDVLLFFGDGIAGLAVARGRPEVSGAATTSGVDLVGVYNALSAASGGEFVRAVAGLWTSGGGGKANVSCTASACGLVGIATSRDGAGFIVCRHT